MLPDSKAVLWQAALITCVVVIVCECQVRACESPQGPVDGACCSRGAFPDRQAAAGRGSIIHTLISRGRLQRCPLCVLI